MNRLKHERVVKLLGVILEDRDYSLVMELIPNGNLLSMLQKVRMPNSSISNHLMFPVLEFPLCFTHSN